MLTLSNQQAAAFIIPSFLKTALSAFKERWLSRFLRTLERALKYRVNNIETITRIAAASLKSNTVDLPAIEVQHDYMEREAYNNGRFCEEQGFDSLGSILKSNESKPSNNIKE